MVVWNFDLLWKSMKTYGTIEKKTMILNWKLWYFTEKYGTMEPYGNMERTLVIYQIKILNKYIVLFTLEKL